MNDQTSNGLEPATAPEQGEAIEPGAAEADPPKPPPVRRRPRRPLSISAISLILLIVGGAIEGYAVALSAGDSIERQYSLAWAFLGATLVITAWALRGRRWWGAAAAIAVSVVGLFAGMAGVYGVLVIASSADRQRGQLAGDARLDRGRGRLDRDHRPPVERLALADRLDSAQGHRRRRPSRPDPSGPLSPPSGARSGPVPARGPGVASPANRRGRSRSS